MYKNCELSIPLHLDFAYPSQTQNSKLNQKQKFFNLIFNDDENTKQKAKNQMKISKIITLHE